MYSLCHDIKDASIKFIVDTLYSALDGRKLLVMKPSSELLLSAYVLLFSNDFMFSNQVVSSSCTF